MKTLKFMLAGASLLWVIGCAEFPEKYENVIEGEKIRPFAIVIEPAEAAPGDTVEVTLRLYDAGKNYSVNWELALNYQVDNYGAFPKLSHIIDLETGSRKLEESEDGLSFKIIIPTGDDNPILLSQRIPENVPVPSQLDGDPRQALSDLGIDVSKSSLSREELVETLDNSPSLPNVMSPLVDGLVALVQFKAKVTSPGFKLDVTKNLSVRYSNRLENGEYLSNVNLNPVIDSIGIIRVKAAGITDIKDIKSHESDTLFLTTGTGDDAQVTQFDTITVEKGMSYFVFARGGDNEQAYLSPGGEKHTEDLFYQWFYTNLDDVDEGWEDLLGFDYEDTPEGLNIAPLKLPKNKSMKHFTLRATVTDWRVEWGFLAARGIDHKVAFGVFEYK